MKRRTPLRTKAKLARKTPLRPVNRERRAKRHERNFGSHADWIRSRRCDLCGAPPPSDPHHARTRGAGGDRKVLVPLCRKCHRMVHAGIGPGQEWLLERARELWARSPENEEGL
jgi:hypothetical protein